jgi:hypothetical protein
MTERRCILTRLAQGHRLGTMVVTPGCDVKWNLDANL